MSDNINEENIHDNTEDIKNSDENITIEEPVGDEVQSDDAEFAVSDEIDANEEVLDEKLLGELETKVNKTKFALDKIPPEKRLKVLSISISCLIIAILILTDIIPILPNAYNRFYVGNTYSIGETQGGAFDNFGKNILYAGNGVIMSFGPDMDCSFTVESPIGAPMLETSGNNAVIYYKNTGNAVVVTNDDNIRNLNYNDVITAATISKSGHYGIVVDESGYESCVEIYNKNGALLYKWHTNNPVIDIAISNDGKSMVASSYEINSSAISAKLVFFDLSLDAPVKEVVLNSNIVSEVKFTDDNSVVAFGDLYTAAYSNMGTMLWKIDYKGRVPKSYDVSEKGEIAFVFDRFSSALSESSVEIYNKDGAFIGSYDSKKNIKYISFNNGYILLSLDRQTVLLENDGDVVKTKNTAKDFKKAVLYNNYNFAFSITDGVAEIMSVKH